MNYPTVGRIAGLDVRFQVEDTHFGRATPVRFAFRDFGRITGLDVRFHVEDTHFRRATPVRVEFRDFPRPTAGPPMQGKSPDFGRITGLDVRFQVEYTHFRRAISVRVEFWDVGRPTAGPLMQGELPDFGHPNADPVVKYLSAVVDHRLHQSVTGHLGSLDLNFPPITLAWGKLRQLQSEVRLELPSAAEYSSDLKIYENTGWLYDLV